MIEPLEYLLVRLIISNSDTLIKIVGAIPVGPDLGHNTCSWHRDQG